VRFPAASCLHQMRKKTQQARDTSSKSCEGNASLTWVGCMAGRRWRSLCVGVGWCLLSPTLPNTGLLSFHSVSVEFLHML